MLLILQYVCHMLTFLKKLQVRVKNYPWLHQNRFGETLQAFWERNFKPMSKSVFSYDCSHIIETRCVLFINLHQSELVNFQCHWYIPTMCGEKGEHVITNYPVPFTNGK